MSGVVGLRGIWALGLESRVSSAGYRVGLWGVGPGIQPRVG